MNHRVFKASDAHKLEDPQRLQWLPPAAVVDSLGLSPRAKVADIGAGTGYFSLPIAEAVGPAGHVYAIDLQPAMLDLLRQKLKHRGGPSNLSLLEGSACATTLPSASVDLVFFANVWHEIDDLETAFREAARIAVSHGKIAILDWRADCYPPPGPPTDHRIDASRVLEFLVRNRCTATSRKQVGLFSYLITADMPNSPAGV